MKIKRAGAIPLITHDPYFSIWSCSDKLNEDDSRHWSGIRQQIRGYITIDGVDHCFWGDPEFHAVIEQKAVDVTATATTYEFENEKVCLRVKFMTPLLLESLLLVSRPCTYLDFEVKKKSECSVQIHIMVSDDLVSSEKAPIVGSDHVHRHRTENKEMAYRYAAIGRAVQHPLGNCGDNITIDWGYVYLAAADETAEVKYDCKNQKLRASLRFDEEEMQKTLILAYDDLLSINYMGQWRKAYWTSEYADILEAIGAAFVDKEETEQKAAQIDEQIANEAFRIAGQDYVYLCNLSYRLSIAAHKLITDDNGNVLFLSKENDSNGCIGTVDVSYPSVPLYLLYNTEYVKGMLRPVFDFASREAWEYDFSPHDVGRYPYAWGQVYGLNKTSDLSANFELKSSIYPPFYMYPAGSDLYDLRYQMPVEECGNMLLMTAAVCMQEQCGAFAEPHREQLKKWTEYLLKYGKDPGEQLCTDDFAGHLAHNVNLSVKAIMGIEAYAQLLILWGDEETAKDYHARAEMMAKDWEERAYAGDHYMLSFGKEDSWSLKYNLIWDKIFGSGLFSDNVYETECAYYVKKRNIYGTPLDSRRNYTKSDWILWCAALTEDKEVKEQIMAPVARYQENTGTRYPFGDWYETDTGDYCEFKGRSVQGGIFMPMLVDKIKRK